MEKAVITPPQADSPPALQASKDTPVSTKQNFPSYNEAVEIAQLCHIAGLPEKTAEYLVSGQSVAQVRNALLSARANTPTISSHLDPMGASPTVNMVMSALQRRMEGGTK